MFLELPGLHVCVLQFSLKELDPAQVFPPQEGSGLLQLLDRDLVPVPHDLLQVDQAAQDPQLALTFCMKYNILTLSNHLLVIPGQQRVLQFSVVVLDPGQFLPPLAGEGLLHLLDRDLVPVPHDLVQEDQLAHDPHLPST